MEAKTKKKRVEKRGVRKKKDSTSVSATSEMPKKKKKTAKKRDGSVKATAGKFLPTHEQIQLRAYFISEQRRHHGIEGNEHSDWLRAEKELRNELLAEQDSMGEGAASDSD